MVIKRRIKLNVYARDNNRCVKCGSITHLTIDHKIPLSAGGSDDFSNLQTLCWNCNQEKNSTYDLGFIERIKSIWNIHALFIELKNSVSGLVLYEKEENKKLIELTCSNKNASLRASLQSEIQSSIDKKTNLVLITYETKLKEFPLLLNGLENTIRLKDKRIADLEQAMISLTEYLKIECVPSKTKPHFRKIHEE